VADPQASETGRRMPDSAWHWEQGTKYAVETIKALLAINGGAAVALLAFAGNIAKNGGNAASVASHLANSVLGFGLGTLLGALGFLTAYLTQLQYGRGGESFRPAHWWHRATYALVILSALAFVRRRNLRQRVPSGHPSLPAAWFVRYGPSRQEGGR
jgi:hypothetical protein